jgi:branched-chain amino acid aminotransferase
MERYLVLSPPKGEGYLCPEPMKSNSPMVITGQKIVTRQAERSRLPETDLSNIKFGRVFSDHMFVMDHEGGEWRSPRIEPFADLEMSPASSVLHYGQSIFEGLKAYRSSKGGINLFRPLANVQRMNRSAVRMCMPQLPEDVFMDALAELVRLDQDWLPEGDDSSLYIRPFMIAADEYIGIKPSDSYKFMIFTCPVRGYYSEPVRVKIELEYSRAFPGGTGFAKCAGNYASALYPAKRAQDTGIHQLIWTDAMEHKYIEESGTMNVFFRIDGVLKTPEAGNTVLEGITRDSIIQLANKQGISLEIGQVSVQEVVDAARSGRLQEAFGAGTAATIAHIHSIEIENETFTLPPIETREVANELGGMLDDIRRGKVKDEFGWVVNV